MDSGEEYPTTEAANRPGVQALAQAADAARYAPSIHNTQPWRWRVHGDAAELYGERRRQLGTLDPDARLLMISCGAALQHALVALAAQGWRTDVDRIAGHRWSVSTGVADPIGTAAGTPDDDLIARVRLSGRSEVDPVALRRFQTMMLRHTDRRAATNEPVDPAAVEAVAQAAVQEHTGLQVLRPDQVIELAVAVQRAQDVEIADPRQRAELARWVGGTRAAGTGVPDAVLPSGKPQTTVPGRDFGRAGSLPVGAGHDTAAVYAVLHGDTDTPLDWLRAGEALSAGWLVAIERGLSLLPFSAPVEVLSTRQALRHLLAGITYPYLALRLSRTDPAHADPPYTPRLAAEQVIEIVDPG